MSLGSQEGCLGNVFTATCPFTFDIVLAGSIVVGLVNYVVWGLLCQLSAHKCLVGLQFTDNIMQGRFGIPHTNCYSHHEIKGRHLPMGLSFDRHWKYTRAPDSRNRQTYFNLQNQNISYQYKVLQSSNTGQWQSCIMYLDNWCLCYRVIWR